MADSGDESEFDETQFDVTNSCVKAMCCCVVKQVLILEPEEAVLSTSDCFSHSTKRMPYGELGSVEQSAACGCCHGFSSNINPKDDKGNTQPIVPGCGCNGELVEKIVAELKARMKGRGDTGNIQRAEEALRLLKLVDAKVSALMAKMQVAPVQNDIQPPKEFPHLDYDVSGCCLKYFCCGNQELNLDAEEANLRTTTPCSSAMQRRPYGELGNVTEAHCCCCVSVISDLGNISPGCGCETHLVQELVAEMKQRMKARGDTGNIQRQEETIHLVRYQDAKLNAIMQKLGLPLPAVPSPTQKVMG